MKSFLLIALFITLAQGLSFAETESKGNQTKDEGPKMVREWK